MIMRGTNWYYLMLKGVYKTINQYKDWKKQPKDRRPYLKLKVPLRGLKTLMIIISGQ
jgi:PHP family Zn ribbon phosphoesterase